LEGLFVSSEFPCNFYRLSTMKKNAITLVIVNLLFIHFAYTQIAKDEKQLKPFLFAKFMSGSVLMKSGVIEDAPLNYNTDNQSVFFIKDGKHFILTETSSIDTVYIQHKKFIPVNESFYEVVTVGKLSLLVTYTNKKRPLVVAADQSGTSRKVSNEVSNNVTDAYSSKLFKANYDIEYQKHFLIEKDGALYKVTNTKKFLKLFSSEKRIVVEKYINDNLTDFNNENDLIALVAFCNNSF
jgi:hypothetical protein